VTNPEARKKSTNCTATSTQRRQLQHRSIIRLNQPHKHTMLDVCAVGKLL
jgi:hypothetical protein